MPSGGTIQRAKKQYVTRPLTPEVARSIGIDQYYQPCRRAFDAILRTLDAQVGRPLLLTAPQIRGKEPLDLLVGDVKPKLDLFRTCIAAVGGANFVATQLLKQTFYLRSHVFHLIRCLARLREEMRDIESCKRSRILGVDRASYSHEHPCKRLQKRV